MRFKKLEELHSCDRDEEKPQVQTKKARTKPAVAAKVAATASSSLKDVIAGKNLFLSKSPRSGYINYACTPRCGQRTST